MRIHYIQHESFEAPGSILKWINQNNFEVTSTKLYEKVWYPSQDSFDFLIIMGGSMSVNDESSIDWLVTEKKFIKESIVANKKVLGICLGSQLIANVLGAKIYPNNYKEIGWFPVKKSALGIFSPLIKHFPNEWITMHWHGETFDLPSTCALLFESEACKNQGFSFGFNTIGLQFHPEMDQETIQGMFDASETLVADKYVQTEKEIINGYHYCQYNNELLFKLLDKLVS